MMNNTFYNEILTDHNLHPAHKKKLEDASEKQRKKPYSLLIFFPE